MGPSSAWDGFVMGSGSVWLWNGSGLVLCHAWDGSFWVRMDPGWMCPWAGWVSHGSMMGVGWFCAVSRRDLSWVGNTAITPQTVWHSRAGQAADMLRP